MNPADFIHKWEKSTLKESAAAQSHFNDLCDLLDEPKPTDVDQTGETYCFEKGATKSTGGQGFADVWKKGCFGWEYKGPHKDLDRAHEQLLRYSVALENPPLLIVSDTKKFIIRTNWTNTIQETHEIALTDLVDAGKRDLLKAAFSSPESLKPKRTRTQLTAEAADEFSDLAQRLRARKPEGQEQGAYARKVAHFVNRLVFCMFAEDVGLLPNKLFEKALRRSETQPDKAQGYLQRLFAAMKDGGEFGLEEIPWFNGGLFDSDEALPMDRDDVALALKAAKLDWQDIDPSILGTLFERGLDPSKRSQLGAHYTDRDKIMMIVNPVIVEPLTKEWQDVKAKIAKHADAIQKADESIAAVKAEAAAAMKIGEGKKAEAARQKQITSLRSRATKAQNAGQKLYKGFLDRLRNFRVLDPACGSGNFLYLSLLALKDLEHKASLDAEVLGLKRLAPRVGPEAVNGIEINPYAAELARVSIWIGEIQWMRRNGFSAQTNPILRPLGNIENRDALIEQDPETGDWREAEWPDTDVIVGNPPFLGGKYMRDRLGDETVEAIFEVYKERNKREADLVTYWFVKAWEKIQANSVERAGLVATNSIRGGANRDILQRISENGIVFNAWSDEPWVVDGASVRVSLISFSTKTNRATFLNGKVVTAIYADLTAANAEGSGDLTKAQKIPENIGVAFMGDTKGGAFDVPGHTARTWLNLPTNPNGKRNAEVLKPWVNGLDVTRRPRDIWIIDFGWQMNEEEASFFEAPFSYAKEKIFPIRKKNKRKRYAEYWWQHVEPRPGMWKHLGNVSKYIATPTVSKHRLFVWFTAQTCPDHQLIAIAREDDTSFGILHSRFHELWSLRMGTSLEDRPRYTPTTSFETFPFPKGLTPDIPTADYADDLRAIRIAEAAARLNELRKNWLNPPELVKRVAEVVEGYPDRILPVDEKAEKILKKRTLTNLYNERPGWLDNAHRALDEAVAAAYGWEEDFKSGALTDEEILKRLFELNQDRARGQAE